MEQTLALKYRPEKFESVLGDSQAIVCKVLQRQLDTGKLRNCYLFSGDSGCGKTTIARCFAKSINKGIGDPIEIDGAVNNGVDNVRAIVDSANQRSLTGEYKIFIIDECHAITSAGWQAFLKGLEEAPKYSIFIFCTTEPNKIPDTILSRVQRYNIPKVAQPLIMQRLCYICEQEGFTNYNLACEYISKIAQGSMRAAISYLEQCSDYDSNLAIENVLKILGDFSVEVMTRLTNFLIDGDAKSVLTTIEKLYAEGRDLKHFISNYLEYIIDLNKYIIFKDIAITNIPAYLETIQDPALNIQYVVGIDNASAWFVRLADQILTLKTMLKNDPSVRATICAYLVKLCRI